jgi:Fic family protein
MKKPEFPPNASIIEIIKDSETLSGLLQNFQVNNRLKEIDRGYPYWDKFKQKVKSLNIEPKLLWQYNKLLRERNVSRINISSEEAGFDFKFNITGDILKNLHEFDMHLGGILEGRSIIPPEEKNRYLISSIMEEAIASSQLEGAATTREIAKEMLRSNRKPTTPDEKMIMNNYITIKRVLEIKDKAISKELILELHSLITKGTLENSMDEGALRNRPVNIMDDFTNEIMYIPPDHEKMEDLIDKFCKYANNDTEYDFIHPIVKGIILHFLIGYIHPFMDGNGRTARALFYWYLISKGYWLVEYMSISKIIIRAPAQYARAYLHTEFDQNDLTYFIQYNLKCLDLALKTLQTYIKRKVMERKNFIHLIQHESINERQIQLLKNLIVDNQKSFTIQEVQTKFDIVYQTSRNDLLGLESLGYIKSKKIGKKLIFFKSDDFEKKLENLLGQHN